MNVTRRRRRVSGPMGALRPGRLQRPAERADPGALTAERSQAILRRLRDVGASGAIAIHQPDSHSRIADPSMTRPLTIAAGLAVALFTLASLPLTASAQDAAPPASGEAEPAAPAEAATTAAVGSPGAGRQRPSPRLRRRGRTGYQTVYPPYHVPMSGGQPALYPTDAPNEYRNGPRRHPTMETQGR